MPLSMEDARLVLPEETDLSEFEPVALRDFACIGVIDAKVSNGRFILTPESLEQYRARTEGMDPSHARNLWKRVMGNDLFSYFFQQASENFDLLGIEPVMGRQGYFLVHRGSLKGHKVSIRDVRTTSGSYQLAGLKTPFGFYRLDEGYLFVPSDAVAKKTTYYSDNEKSRLWIYRDNFDAIESVSSS
ncbi:MAG: hypothetical protein HY517_03215 [Candidatus Aenigmarchaeota archaeon]|nr:hypothetical protein [Candidatus Aenigmarchaeota archaeon]